MKKLGHCQFWLVASGGEKGQRWLGLPHILCMQLETYRHSEHKHDLQWTLLAKRIQSPVHWVNVHPTLEYIQISTQRRIGDLIGHSFPPLVLNQCPSKVIMGHWASVLFTRMVCAKPSVLAKFQLRLLLVVQLEHQIQIPLTLMKPGVDSELYHSHASLVFTCYLPKFTLHFYLFLSRCMYESLT